MERKRLPLQEDIQLWAAWSGRGRREGALDWRRPSTDRFVVPSLGPTGTAIVRHVLMPAIAEVPSGFVRVEEMKASIGHGKWSRLRAQILRLERLDYGELLIEGDQVVVYLHPFVVPKFRPQDNLPTRWVDAYFTELESYQQVTP